MLQLSYLFKAERMKFNMCFVEGENTAYVKFVAHAEPDFYQAIFNEFLLFILRSISETGNTTVKTQPSPGLDSNSAVP